MVIFKEKIYGFGLLLKKVFLQTKYNTIITINNSILEEGKGVKNH